MPPPLFWTAPVPEMFPPNVTLLVRLKTNAPLFVTSPAIDPVVPPLPICNVPAAIVVPPV